MALVAFQPLTVKVLKTVGWDVERMLAPFERPPYDTYFASSIGPTVVPTFAGVNSGRVKLVRDEHGALVGLDLTLDKKGGIEQTKGISHVHENFVNSVNLPIDKDVLCLRSLFP